MCTDSKTAGFVRLWTDCIFMDICTFQYIGFLSVFVLCYKGSLSLVSAGLVFNTKWKLEVEMIVGFFENESDYEHVHSLQTFSVKTSVQTNPTETDIKPLWHKTKTDQKQKPGQLRVNLYNTKQTQRYKAFITQNKNRQKPSLYNTKQNRHWDRSQTSWMWAFTTLNR